MGESDIREGIQGFWSSKDIFVVIMQGWGLPVLFSSLELGMSHILQCRGGHTQGWCLF